ncbi:MAG: hypothetical protein HYT87_03380 [Nitrospirae bacterium]|nr:hypothetical protein [Nitrospirota bacterium]
MPPISTGDRPRSTGELLATPLRDLGLRVEGTQLETCAQELVAELRKAGIAHLNPDFYLGFEYGVPSKSRSMSMLFMDAATKPDLLAALAENGERPCTPREVRMCMRHESGHLFCYAYELFELEEFRTTFEVEGDYLDYPHWTKPWKGDPESPKHVKYLEVEKLAPACYAQKHPDDDFAETFAVWLDPATRWLEKYSDRPIVLGKLEYVGRLVKEWGGRRPKITRRSSRFSIARSSMTLREYLNWE